MARFSKAEQAWFDKGEPKPQPKKPRLEIIDAGPRELTPEQHDESLEWANMVASVTNDAQLKKAGAAKAHRDHVRRVNKANDVPSDTVVVDWEAKPTTETQEPGEVAA